MLILWILLLLRLFSLLFLILLFSLLILIWGCQSCWSVVVLNSIFQSALNIIILGFILFSAVLNVYTIFQAILTVYPKELSSGKGLAWWAILLIVLGAVVILGCIVACFWKVRTVFLGSPNTYFKRIDWTTSTFHILHWHVHRWLVVKSSVDVLFIHGIWPHRIWPVIFLITRWVCDHSRWHLLFPGPIHTLRFSWVSVFSWL